MADEFDFSSDEEQEEWKCDEEGVLVDCMDNYTGSLNAASEQDMTPSEENYKKKISRMDLNTSKAGMEGLDRDKINQIILEASKGSRFYENERKKEKQVQKRIKELQNKMVQLSNEQKFKARQEMDKIVHELENSRDLSRTIVHVDMDAFFAAVEMRDNPNLKSKPMAVGSNSMLCTSNYLARRYGVRAAMPGFIGKKLCPQLVIVPTNFEKYTKISQEIRQVMACYDPNYLPLSLDEAYLDLTDFLRTRRSLRMSESGGEMKDKGMEQVGDEVEEVVKEMRSKIEEKTTLTASAGIAPNMFLAKVCSDQNKPNGQFYLKPEKKAIAEFIRKLPLRKAFGIGRVSEQILKSVFEINTCAELFDQRELLHLLFTPTACRSYLEISLGLGSTVIDINRERKSMSTETTFREINKAEEHFSKCYDLCCELSESLKSEGLFARKVGVKLKTVNFEVKSRICSAPNTIQEADEIFYYAKKLLCSEIKACLPQPLRLRLMGVRAAEFCQAQDTIKECKQPMITSLFKQSGGVQVTIPGESNAGTSSRTSCGQESLLDEKQPPCDDVMENMIENKSTPSCSKQQSSVNNENQKTVKKSAEEEEKLCDEHTNLICPVCEKNLSFNPGDALVQFNRHVDACLSTQAITDLLKEDSRKPLKQEQQTSGKRKRHSPSGKAKRRTLEHFLMK